jgi:hypothetical protein
MTRKSTTWKYIKKDMKEFLNPWLWTLALLTSVIANVISYFTGWSMEYIMAVIFGLLLVIMFTPVIAYLAVNKIKLMRRNKK